MVANWPLMRGLFVCSAVWFCLCLCAPGVQPCRVAVDTVVPIEETYPQLSHPSLPGLIVLYRSALMCASPLSIPTQRMNFSAVVSIFLRI
eukprot:198272-Pyramimonas_sp.AAC.1